MSEAQKTQGALYKEKKKGPQNGANQAVPRTPTISYDTTVAKVDVPPMAPSPPRAGDAVNVFDFLVQDGSPATTESSRPSPRKLKADASSPRIHPSADQTPHQVTGYTYGSGPIPGTLQRYESDFSLAADSQFGAMLSGSDQTPAHLTRIVEPPGIHKDKSEKKRKRPHVDDLDLVGAKADRHDGRRSLHTGLTGGLSKLLANAEDKVEEASPSSPKKRSKQSRHHKRDDSSDDDKPRRRRDKHKHGRQDSNGDMQLVRTDAASKALELHGRGRQLARTGPVQKSEQSNSEFFLSLVDKGPKSSKGQSIWGALKTFHEGLVDDDISDPDDVVDLHQSAERALFRGLRMKLNRDGEIVLFARADKEHSVAPE